MSLKLCSFFPYIVERCMRFSLLVTTLIQKQLITQNKKISASAKQTAVCGEDAFPASPFVPPRTCPSSAGGSQRAAGRPSHSFCKQHVLLRAAGRQWKRECLQLRLPGNLLLKTFFTCQTLILGLGYLSVWGRGSVF